MLDLKDSYIEFMELKRQNHERNYEYYLLRQAVRGNFRWPRDWPSHIPKVKHNMCKPITERFATYLIGSGFTFNVDRPNSLEYRDKAERTEKILRALTVLSDGDLQFEMGAKIGAQLGRTIYKVYKKGKEGKEFACFSYCQPDYFYSINSGDNSVGDHSVVYYSYPLDRAEAKRQYGDKEYLTELEVQRELMYDIPPERMNADTRVQQERNVPVLEVWTKDEHLLAVGGQEIYNDVNVNKWDDTGEGFIPFVVIENVRNAGEGVGESDIGQVRELNETLNYTISRKLHIVNRWLQPTLVWEGAPQNFAEVLTNTIGGGGAIPARLGSRLYFLAYDRPNPQVEEILALLRQAMLETAGMNEMAMMGTVHGSINTGPSLQAQFQPVISTVGKKRLEWTAGLEKLFAMLLNKQEQIGDSGALPEVVVNQTNKSQTAMPTPPADPNADPNAAPTQVANDDGELVQLSGKDIAGLRRVTIKWPPILPQDDEKKMALEIQKSQQGMQSIYTTLEKMGEEYPDDEISRIRRENQDPTLRGQVVAEQMRSQAPLIRAQAQAAQTLHDTQQPPPGQDPNAPPPDQGAGLAPGPNDGIGGKLRALARHATPQVNAEHGTIDAGQPGGY